MDSGLKKILRAVSLELRHVLEGRYDDQGRWLAGDLERRLNELGVWRDRPAKPLAELSHLSAEDKAARHVVDAYLRLRDEAGVARNEAVAEFVREAAYTWANRLFALRCMEARGIIDEVILQKETYGGQSMVHSRFARRNPEACAGEDDGLFAVLFAEFTERAKDLPVLFNPHAPAVALRPSVTALKKCIALLSGREAVRGQEPASDAVFEAPDAFGWAYQYWNAEEKDRVFEMVRTKKGAKIEGADIIPATCIYTEPYMVKFLVQNSLGAPWMGMHPESSLSQGWEYYVKDADRAPVEKKPVAVLTFLDPACGSGHFLLEAFDLLYTMYEEEGTRGSGLGVREGARGSGLGAREEARGSGLGAREGAGEGARDSGLGTREGAREGARGSGLGAREGEGYEREQLSGIEGLAGRHGAGGAGVSADMGVSQAGDVWTEQSNAASINIDSVQPGGGTQQGLDPRVSALHFDRHGLIGGTGDPTTHGRAIGIRAEDRIDPASHQDRRARQNASRPTKIPETEANPSDLVPSPQPLVPSPQPLVPSPSSLASSPQSLASSPSSLVPPPQPLTPSAICAAILNNNLFGIDIDERAVQIAEAALWMKAKEKAPDLEPTALRSFRDHLVATNIRLPKGKDHLQAFLKNHPEDQPLRSALEAVFQGLENAHELGSLLQIEEPVEKELRYLKVKFEENKGKLEQQALFAEVAKPRQEELPLGVESYEQWKARTLVRLKSHFGDEAEAADPVQAFFGQSAEKGLVLFGLLSRRYDVVAANPPYMGSRNMAPALKNYVFSKYPDAKLDLYQAFFERVRLLTDCNERFALVTPQSWLTHRTLEKLRRTLLEETLLEACAHLGNGAFGEIGGAVVSSTLAVFSRSYVSSAYSTFLRLTDEPTPEAKALSLARLIKLGGDRVYRVKQWEFLSLPKAPVLYELPPELLVLFSSSLVQGYAQIRAGLQTSNNTRFVRFVWEICNASSDLDNNNKQRWVPYEKAGSYCRWFGLQHYFVDWQYDGIRIKAFIRTLYGGAHWSKNVRNTDRYFLPGITYSDVSGYNLGARIMEGGQIWDICSPAIFPSHQVEKFSLLASLNSRITTCLLRRVTSGAMHVSGLERVPLKYDSTLSTIGRFCVQQKARLAKNNLTERTFLPPVLAQKDIATQFSCSLEDEMETSLMLLCAEAMIDNEQARSYNLSVDAQTFIYDQTGKAAGLLPFVSGYEAMPKNFGAQLETPQELLDFLETSRRNLFSAGKGTDLKPHLHSLYEKGSGANLRNEEIDVNALDNDEDDEGLDDTTSSHLPIPAETLLEEVSISLGIHPISVYWLVKEGRKKDGWRCLPEERRFTEDTFTVMVLCLLGHRWPKQIEAGESVPTWADQDGIIPIIEGSGEKILLERIRERIPEEFLDSNVANIEREFEDITGVSLEKWLAGPFFKRHISQLKKRPIAWQVQSGARGWGLGTREQGLGTREKGLGVRKKKKATGYSSGPVFSCFVYYHKLDADLLPKIRSQYVGPLRSGYETELRALERIESPTADQSARKVQLTNWIDELTALDEKLSEVIVSGFGPESLLGQLRQFAVDDAMLALKARWLRKLVGVVREGPLESWKQAAFDTELHPEFPEWIHDTLMHLDHYCSVVGPKPPEEKTLNQDPDSAYLAALICRETKAMVSNALARACQKWWKQFDEAVIAPIRQQIAELNEQIKLRKEERELVDLQTTPYRRVEIEREIEDLKDQVSALKDEQAQKVATGQRVRAQIEGWTCPEAERWEPWLAVQPLYDQISSLDGQRLLPRTGAEFVAQESAYAPDVNDGVRVNIAPLQRAGLLPAEVIAKKDLEKAIADRAEWRADERRWCREGKLPQPGWWKKEPGLHPLETEERVILSRSAAEAKNLSAPRQKRDSSSLRSSE